MNSKAVVCYGIYMQQSDGKVCKLYHLLFLCDNFFFTCRHFPPDFRTNFFGVIFLNKSCILQKMFKALYSMVKTTEVVHFCCRSRFQEDFLSNSYNRKSSRRYPLPRVLDHIAIMKEFQAIYVVVFNHAVSFLLVNKK